MNDNAHKRGYIVYGYYVTQASEITLANLDEIDLLL